MLGVIHKEPEQACDEFNRVVRESDTFQRPITFYVLRSCYFLTRMFFWRSFLTWSFSTKSFSPLQGSNSV